MEIEQLKHTVSYSRKKNLGNYASEDVGLFVQFQTSLDASLADIMTEARSLQYVLKAEVLEHLGISYEVDPQSGEVTETGPVMTAPPTKKSPPPAAEGDAFDAITDDGGVPSAPPFPGDTTDKEERKANAAWAKARHELYPGEFWDNRAKKAEKGWTSPDFVHKDSRAGYYA